MKKYQIPLDVNFDLRNYDASEYKQYKGDKQKAKDELFEIRKELAKLQKIHYAEQKHKILVILQGMDTSGKDGTARNVFEGMDINGVKVEHFKKPSAEDLRRDFLWRVHKKVPADGEIVIFNRSHYEDILIVRVQNLKPKEIWENRYRHIRDFEKLLSDEGTKIIKIFLHIDHKEQTKRLQRRIDNPEKHWKIESNDFKDRDLWDDYVHAYNDAINETNTDYAPWHIVPSNKKWYRNLITGKIILNEFMKLEFKFPPPKKELEGLVL